MPGKSNRRKPRIELFGSCLSLLYLVHTAAHIRFLGCGSLNFILGHGASKSGVHSGVWVGARSEIERCVNFAVSFPSLYRSYLDGFSTFSASIFLRGIDVWGQRLHDSQGLKTLEVKTPEVYGGGL